MTESAKYEINTKISNWESQERIDSIRKNLKTHQDVKLVIIQFFKKRYWRFGRTMVHG